MVRAFFLLPAALATQAPPELADMIANLDGMKENVQTLHNSDADSYEKVSCYCDKESKQLTDDNIPTAATNVNNAAATIEKQTARKEQEQLDLAQNEADKLAAEKMEQEQLDAWTKRSSELSAAIAETTQAANALGSAKDVLGDHASLMKLVDDMMAEVSTNLKDYNKAKTDEGADRDSQHQTYSSNIKTYTADIKSGKEAIADAKKQIGEAQTDLLENEADLKKFSTQLTDLTKYCEEQAADWDSASASRSKDFHVLTLAINVLSCGQEECGADASGGSFLQKSMTTKHKSALGQSENAKRAAVMSLARLGQRLGEKSMVDLGTVMKNALGRDPLLKVKKLIRGLIEKLIKEQAADTAQMGECAAQLEECTLKRDDALEFAAKLRLEAEGLGAKTEADKEEAGVQEGLFEEGYNTASELGTITIPTMIKNYDDSKAELTRQKEWISKAIGILQAHFGTSDNQLRAEPVSNTPDSMSTASEGQQREEGAVDRKTGGRGETQSAGASVVRMFKTWLTQRKSDLKTLKTEHVVALKDSRMLKNDNDSNAAGAKSRFAELSARIEADTSKFNAAIAELDSQLEKARQNGRCVQQLEPCGVQTDRRAKREAEMAALKNAWDILNKDTEGNSMEPTPGTWM